MGVERFMYLRWISVRMKFTENNHVIIAFIEKYLFNLTQRQLFTLIFRPMSNLETPVNLDAWDNYFIFFFFLL